MMRKLLVITAIAAAWMPLACARVINVADEGIVPGADVTLRLNLLMASIKDEPGVTLIFPKGTYEFYPEDAQEIYRRVANHDNSLKRMGFPLFGCKNITIDGGGSTFMFHGRIVPFVVDGADGVTLKNFSIDWARAFHDELRVVESDENGKFVILEADPTRYPQTIERGRLRSIKYDWKDDMSACIVWDPKTRSPIFNTQDYATGLGKHTATRAGDNRYRLEANFGKEAPPVGSVLISYGARPTSRLCPAIHLANSKDITIMNVTIYAAGGMGLIAERVENVHVDAMTVTSTRERLVSTRADATHFLGCKGQIRVENSLFEHMLDDGINVHGAYVKVVEYLGNNTFLCEISHFQQWGVTFAESGDKVALLSSVNLQPFHQTTITETRVLNEKRLLVTLADMPQDMPEGALAMENLSWYPDLVFRNNIIRENRARGLLVTTKGKVLIENNIIASQMHGILIEGDNNVWYESGGVEDVTIRNNTFVNVGFDGAERYPLYASPKLTGKQRLGDERFHRNITFANNTIRSFSGSLVFARSVGGLTIEDNSIEFSADYPGVTGFPAIDLSYCDTVSISGNKANGFGRSLTIRPCIHCTNVKIGDNSGFEGN